ncbi:helix-turn-helix domain-containing protein [Legionella shakespearei]|uniref:Transcriptional regulator n=1 Tax=Legionella shakespearei DSM 23087 TaxID=1122169 RepID=A0A0W0YT79_9GAMM|nr:helix-turn-helix domain-containing protein [Legionella shakespearei]KTD60036.1 transcriptional regulator [Legionella shakespearei DSM 23087]
MKNNLPHQQIVILGQAIERERKRRRLTQTQLAELSNTSINFVSQIERGKKTAQIGKIIDVLQILGLQLVIERGSSGLVNPNE